MNIDLSTQDGFNVASGVRGSDVDSNWEVSVVKWVLTARLRGLAGAHNPAGSMVRTTSDLLDGKRYERFMIQVPNLETFMMGIQVLPYHYLSHTRDAFSALGNLLEPESDEQREALLLYHLAANVTMASGLAMTPERETSIRTSWDALFGEKNEG